MREKVVEINDKEEGEERGRGDEKLRELPCECKTFVPTFRL